jgi:hypothetical protein
MNFKFQPPSTFIFLVLHKTFSLKAVYPLNIYDHAKLHDPKLAGSNFCIHLRSLNVLHFGMAKATRLKLWRRGNPQ